jgi:molybdenum cofactor guanylyltransferase
MNSEYKKENITAIILSGGKSSRMGTEKGLLEFKGKPLVVHAIETMEKIAGRIMVSANYETYRQFGHEVVYDEVPECGPIGGLFSCLNKSETEINIVLSVDTPNVPAELYYHLLNHISGKDIVLPMLKTNQYEPLCAFYHRDMRNIFGEFIKAGNSRIPDIFEMVRFKAVPVENENYYSDGLFANINYMKDFIRLNQQ